MIYDFIKKLEVTIEIISYRLLLSIVVPIIVVFLLDIIAYLSSSMIDYILKNINMGISSSSTASTFVYEVNREAKFRMHKFGNSGTSAYRTFRNLITVKKKTN